MLFHFPSPFLKKTLCCIIEKSCPNACWQFAADRKCCSHDFSVLCFHTALNFLQGLNSCQHFSVATCFLHDIHQAVLPPERPRLQPRENFTLRKNGKSVTAGVAKAAHVLPSDCRLTQHSVSAVWVRDIMTVVTWDPTLLSGRGTYLVPRNGGSSWASCGLAAACTVLICSCLRDWICTYCEVEEHR